MTLAFRETTSVDHSRPGPFEAAMLSDPEKESLCRSLLAEFGVTSVKVIEPRGELVHCCPLPWHDDRSPSAHLNYKKLAFRCWSCDSAGGLLWFIATCRGETDNQSRIWLERQTGTGAEEQPLAALLSFIDSVYGQKDHYRPPIPKMSPRVLEPLMRIHPYLTDPIVEGGRGIPEETLMRFQVGYGVIPTRVSSQTVQSHRIVIPHFWRGDLVGWQSRRIVNDGTAKYQSTPDMPRDETLYNYEPRARRAVVVESPMSVLSKAHLAPHLEATFGASVTDRQCRLLADHSCVVLFFDNDLAGWKAIERVSPILEAYSEVLVVDSPWAADPADMDDDTYLTLVEEAIPFALWKRPVELQKWAA